MSQEVVTQEAPAEAPDTSTPAVEPESILSTGNDSLDSRLAAAAAEIGDDDDEPLPELPKPAGKKPGKVEAKAEGEEEAAGEKKPRNMMRDLASEWATARRAQRENTKRAQELEARAQQIEEQRREAEEIALYMQGHPIKAVERLAAKAGMRPSEYLQRLQMAYINGEEEPKQAAPNDAIAQELAALRAELQAEKNRRVEEEQAAAYQQQLVAITQQETATLVDLAKTYSDNFPALAALSDEAMAYRVADAVQFFVSNGHEVGRFEVLQAVNNVVQKTLAEYGLADTLRSRAVSAPAAQADKSSNASRGVKPRNGSSRNIPTNAAAANHGGVARALSHEERLAEAAKVLFSGE
jgi:hypothetical protein